MTFTENEFIKIAEDALEQIPLQLRQAIQNVAIVLEEEPPPERPGILGLYQECRSPNAAQRGTQAPSPIPSASTEAP